VGKAAGFFVRPKIGLKQNAFGSADEHKARRADVGQTGNPPPSTAAREAPDA
jgi:hypothetical protein